MKTKQKTLQPLDSSVPANNEKIIQLYNKLRTDQLIVNKDYQRKLVWKTSHKINFIETILRNYPFPEIYTAPGLLDPDKIELQDEIVDGQQRLTTIRSYIEETDIFGTTKKLSIKKFGELNNEEKKDFLNYEVSVRYLKNASPEQIKDIFQRINKTDYALNSIERTNAQWGDSEFVCFAKQILDPSFDSDSIVYKIDAKQKKKISKFFLGNDIEAESIFTGNDISRMLALQYIMTLIATLIHGQYFNRNELLDQFIKNYNNIFNEADEIVARLVSVIDFVEYLELKRTSRWYNKANIFSLLVELDKVELQKLNRISLRNKLIDFDTRAIYKEFEDLFGPLPEKMNKDEIQYLNFAREAVNEKFSRIFRGEFISKMIKSSMNAD